MIRSASSAAYTSSTQRTTMLRNGFRTTGSSPTSAAASRASGDSRSAVEREAGERPARGRSRARELRVERVRPLDVLLGEVLVVLRDGDVEPAVRDDAAAVDRVLARMVERDELVVLLVVGEVEAAR